MDGRSVTISSDQNCTEFYVFDGSTLTVNQGVTLTLNISNGNSFNLFDNSTLQLHGTLAGSVASGATWEGDTYINVYLSDGAKYTVTGLTCMDGDNYLRYYGYDAATDGNGTVSVTSGSTAVTASSIGYKTTTYTFTATPASGYKFKNWTKGAGGEVLGTDASINVTCEQNGQYQVYANFEEDAPATFSVTVAWDKTSKTGTFNMPGGNVTLEPEYYPQAALAAAPTAINDVPATTDGAIVEAGTVKNIGETTTAQGTVMYYVSPTALDDAALLALAADQWTADVPTAADLAQGQAYVYYYVRGNDSDTDDEIFSDGDILAANALTVTIAAEPTYAVTFAEGTEESDEWTASPAADVKKGQTVTVTYSGTKKVIGVKAEKKAAAEEPVADIVWDATNVTDLEVWGTLLSYEKEGVTLSGNADQVQAEWNNSAYLETPGMEFIMMESGGFTFTAPAGKAFTKIEMKAQGLTGWNNVNLGTGWTYFEDDDNEIFTVTWKGSAASAVKLLKDADMFSGDFISSIAFYLSE